MQGCGSALRFTEAQTVLISHLEDGAFILEFVNLSACRSRLYRRFALTEPAGTTYTAHPRVAGDLQTFVYSRAQDLSELFVVSGWT
jgi:hypothetical protein